MRGNIVNEEYAVLSRIYAFNALRSAMPGNITPTDIDSRYLVERNKHFLWFEFKTEGGEMPYGQKRAWDALLYRGRPVDSLIVARHCELSRVDVPGDIIAFTISRWDECCKSVATTCDLQPGKLTACIAEWFKHAEEKPNSFITTFRQRAGIYPGSEPEFV